MGQVCYIAPESAPGLAVMRIPGPASNRDQPIVMGLTIDSGWIVEKLHTSEDRRQLLLARTSREHCFYLFRKTIRQTGMAVEESVDSDHRIVVVEVRPVFTEVDLGEREKGGVRVPWCLSHGFFDGGIGIGWEVGM